MQQVPGQIGRQRAKLRLLGAVNAAYLKSQIESGTALRTKKALQEICRLYRVGYRVRPEQLPGMEQSIIGLIYTLRRDEKVRRWALNALARLGREANCIKAVKHVLQDFPHEPQTMAAAIAAAYRISRDPGKVIRSANYDPSMVTLAALQHVHAKDLDLSALPIDVETASADLLKLALVVVGLDRAPAHMLNPRHSNSQMVRALGTHHESTVAQYTVWAITENSGLGIRDLGIDLRDIESQPPNVRAWMFQVVAMSADDAEAHLDVIVLGTHDLEPEAKVGLATGLRDVFFPALEEIVLDWFTREADTDVSHLLLDHMVRQTHHSAEYETLALDFYEKEHSLRQRFEANAAGLPIYSKMKKIAFDGASDLFRGGTNVTNNYHISGGVQAGAVSLGGDAHNSGTTSVHYSAETLDAIRSELSKAERELYLMTLREELKQEALAHLHAANADPAPDKISKAIETLKKVEALAKTGLNAGMALAGIAAALGKIAGLG